MAILGLLWHFHLSIRGFLVASGLLVFPALVFFIKFNRRVWPFVRDLAQIFVPFILVTFLQGFWYLATDVPTFQPNMGQRTLNPMPKGERVFFFLFDELDYRLVFAERPPDVKLPEIDRWLGESFLFQNVLPPGSNTQYVIPGILTGHRASETIIAGPSELMVTWEGATQSVPFSKEETLFSEAAKLGFNVGTVSWVHPLGRLFGQWLYCASGLDLPDQKNSMGKEFWPILWNQNRSLFKTTNFSFFGQSLVVKNAAQQYQKTLGETLRLIKQPEIDLVFIHWSVPHPPIFYNSKTHDYTLGNMHLESYCQNLGAVDEALGKIRRTMEEMGIWRKVPIIICSDHCFRAAPVIGERRDEHVPILVKLPEPAQGRIDRLTSTLILKDMALEFLQGRLNNPKSFSEWVNFHSAP